MNSVGIDVSKGKSMVAALRPLGEIAMRPKEFPHTSVGLEQMACSILALGDDTKVVMEATGHYHEPVAQALSEYGIFVCVLNPILIHQCGGNSVRKVKSDKADSIKIAKYGLDNWVQLKAYTPVDILRRQLKTLNRQYDFYTRQSISLKNNLIAICDKVFPGVNEIFHSPEKDNGHQKWVDFVYTFWHCDCICHISEKSFIDRYQKWCKRNHYHFSIEKAFDVYASSCGHITTMPKDSATKFLVTTAVKQLVFIRETIADIKAEMLSIAEQLPEFDTVMGMFGVGKNTGVQLMAEIGDVTRFPKRSSLIAFAGVDPSVDESGKKISGSNPTTKRGSPYLRKVLFQVVSTYVKKAPDDEPVYQFICKKRNEGKHYLVYMTAASNKFLRIYYARVKEILDKLN